MVPWDCWVSASVSFILSLPETPQVRHAPFERPPHAVLQFHSLVWLSTGGTQTPPTPQALFAYFLETDLEVS